MNINSFYKLLVFASGVTLIISMLIHISTFFMDLIDIFPTVKTLHLFIFLIAGSGIIVALKQNMATADKTLKTFLKMIHAPNWILILAAIIIIYANVNTGFLMYIKEGYPEALADGSFVLKNHGTLIRTISEQEFHLLQAHVLRLLSGLGMLFSAATVALVWPGGEQITTDFPSQFGESDPPSPPESA